MAFMTSSSCCKTFKPEITACLSFLSITLDSWDIKAPNIAHGSGSVFTSSFTTGSTGDGTSSSSLPKSMNLPGSSVKASVKAWGLMVFSGDSTSPNPMVLSSGVLSWGMLSSSGSILVVTAACAVGISFAISMSSRLSVGSTASIPASNARRVLSSSAVSTSTTS